jgi:eukaryotic-like serine/threonine-protein kinase
MNLSIKPGMILAGHYEVLAPPGEGGFAEVFRAADLILQREVALKILKIQQVSS